MNTVLFAVEVSLLHVLGLPSIPSPTTWPPLPSLSHTTPQRSRLSGLRHFLAGSSVGPAESGSFPYGLLVHLQLLSTSFHKNAVTVSYRPECACLKRTRTSLTKHARRRTGRRLRRRFRPVPQPTCEVPAVIAVRDRSHMSFLGKAQVPLIASNKLQALGPGIVGTETDRMVCCGVVPARRVILSRPKQRQQSETSIVLSRHLSSQLLIFGCLTEKQIRPRHNVAE